MADNLTKSEVNRLIDAARLAREQAYAPYSNFPVGAAVLINDSEIYSGCNVENISYGLSNCAERTALFKAVSEGNRQIRAVAIFADTDRFCSPCGACRQVIAEFGRDVFVIQANNRGEYIINTIDELLPGGFTAEIMGKGAGV